MDREFSRHARIAVDAAPLIYFLTEADPWWPLVEDLLTRASRGGIGLVVSVVTELELRVGPLRHGDARGLGAIDKLLSQRGFEVKPVTREIGRAAASIRARHGLGVPDALVAASATVEGCSALFGNDAGFHRVDGPWTYLHADDLVRRKGR